MKYLLGLFALFVSAQATANPTKIAMYCQARHISEERNRIFFYVSVDTETYDANTRTIKGLVFERIQFDGPYSQVDFNAFYKSDSNTNPEFYVRQKNIEFGDFVLDLEIYPIANKTFGYSFLEIKKDGKFLNGYCERADYHDGFWNN